MSKYQAFTATSTFSVAIFTAAVAPRIQRSSADTQTDAKRHDTFARLATAKVTNTRG